MSDEKTMVEEYANGVKQMLGLDAWTINIRWQGSGNNVGIMAMYDYEKQCIDITISEALLETEQGVNDLFQSIVNKMVKIMSGEVMNVIQKFEQQIQKVVCCAMRLNTQTAKN